MREPFLSNRLHFRSSRTVCSVYRRYHFIFSFISVFRYLHLIFLVRFSRLLAVFLLLLVSVCVLFSFLCLYFSSAFTLSLASLLLVIHFFLFIGGVRVCKFFFSLWWHEFIWDDFPFYCSFKSGILGRDDANNSSDDDYDNDNVARSRTHHHTHTIHISFPFVHMELAWAHRSLTLALQYIFLSNMYFQSYPFIVIPDDQGWHCT